MATVLGMPPKLLWSLPREDYPHRLVSFHLTCNALCLAQSEVGVARGVCRTRSAESGVEYARVDYGTGPRLSTVVRSLYDRHGYKPPYDELPPCEESS